MIEARVADTVEKTRLHVTRLIQGLYRERGHWLEQLNASNEPIRLEQCRKQIASCEKCIAKLEKRLSEYRRHELRILRAFGAESIDPLTRLSMYPLFKTDVANDAGITTQSQRTEPESAVTPR